MSYLRNKTLILTGASRGIGRALAQQLAGCGTSLVLNARSGDQLEETAELCRGANPQVSIRTVVGNAANTSTARDLVRGAVAGGQFAGFVHAAGVLAPGPALWELDRKRFDEVFEASVTGAFQMVRFSMPHLLTGGGVAVFFGSGAASRPIPGIAAYCAAKAAEEHLARQLAAEAPTVASFVYRPGIVETRMQKEARQSEGAGAAHLHSVFRPWKEQDQLLTPAQAAGGLMNLLQSGGPQPPLHLSGQTCRVGQAHGADAS